MIVPDEGYAFKDGTIYGISASWFRTTFLKKDMESVYFSIELPTTINNQIVTRIGDNAFSGYSSEKGNMKDAIGNLGTDDCKFMIVGIVNLANDHLAEIGKQTFNGCTDLTGVILPDTLEVLGTADGKSGSVFNGCTGLEFVRTADSDEDTVFELPDGLKIIGKQCFQGCTGMPTNTTVVIPASVPYVGSEAFDETDSAIGTIVVQADNASGYDGSAFKDNDTDYGLGKRLIVFPNAAAKDTFSPSGLSAYRNACTYEFTLHYGNEEDAVTEIKLYGQAANVCKTDGVWAVNEDYVIPEAELPTPVEGYTGGWTYGGKLLTPKTILKPTGDDLYLDIQNVLQDPTVEFIVNDQVIEADDTSPELQVRAGSTIGVQVSHPVQDVDVKFEYQWIDVWRGGTEGPRMEEDNFGTDDWNTPLGSNTITIRGSQDERTSSQNYTGEDYGDGYYLLIIYGYSKPKDETQWTKFYQSANTAIAPNPGRTVNTAYLFDVVIEEPIIITPADISIYTGGEGYTGVVDNTGHETTANNGLPEPGFYITLPKSLNEEFGGTEKAVDLSDLLTLTYDDGQGTKREWTLDLYGTDAHSTDIANVKTARYIYRIVPAEGQDPVRVQFTDPDTNETIVSDEFTPSLNTQYKEYNMKIYSGELNPDKLTAQIRVNGQLETRGIESDTGKLSIRGLTDEKITSEIQRAESAISDDKISAVASEDVTYYINGSQVELSDDSGVKLLVDDVLDDGVLVKYIQDSMSEKISAGDYAYEQKYLDLVDTKNGNAYLTMGENDKLAIYWPVPDHFDSSKEFYVIHFDGLDRNYEDITVELQENEPDIQVSELVMVDGKQYVRFETGEFSPFVLVYQQKQEYAITATAGEHGLISPNGLVSVEENSNQIFTITPDTGYHIDDVLVDGTSIGAVSTYTFENVTSNHTISAIFEKDSSGGGGAHHPEVGDGSDSDTYTIKAEAGKGGSISPDGKVEVKYGKDQTFRMEADEGYEIKDVLVDDESVGAIDKYTFEDVRDDHTIEVTFAKIGSDKTGVSAWLNTTDHMAYLNGYTDGSFGVNAVMTRAEAAQIFYNLLIDQNVPVTVSFTDVPADAWYADAVHTLASLGMIEGMGDGQFNPERSITRAEFTAIAMRFAQAESDGALQFIDVQTGDWFYDAVAGATALGWINGYNDGTFRPHATITRAEVTAITNRMLGRVADVSFVQSHAIELRQFTDITSSHWATTDIVEATNTHSYTLVDGVEVWDALA